MSTEDPNYIAALDKAGEIFPEPSGLSKITNITEVIKQNNTIIELLVSLHKRVSRIEAELVRKPDEQSQIEETLAEITSKLSTISASEKREDIIRKSSGNILVWNSPLEQIRQFKEKK